MNGRGEKSLGQLFSELASELRTLFRQELLFFTAEMKEKITEVAKDGGLIGLGAFLCYCSVLVLVAAAVLGLTTVLPAWGAALLVGAVLLVAGTALVAVGSKKLTRVELKPEETGDTIKETVQWAKTLRHARRTARRTSFASRSATRKAI